VGGSQLEDMDAKIENVLEKMMSISTILNPEEKLDVIKDNPYDNKFLECALASNATTLSPVISTS